jgi:hypothetical protein
MPVLPVGPAGHNNHSGVHGVAGMAAFSSPKYQVLVCSCDSLIRQCPTPGDLPGRLFRVLADPATDRRAVAGSSIEGPDVVDGHFK